MIMIPCSKCDHMSHNAMSAHEHWRMHRLEGRQPITRKGMLVTFIDSNGEKFTDVVTDVQFDKETGEEKITMGEPDPLARYMALVASVQDKINILTLGTKPTLRQRVSRWINEHLRRS